MKKRILSTLLAVCIAASLLTLPAGAAAGGGFTDISDRTTAIAAECLRLMGVMDGYNATTFGPEGQVTRAQFCKMAVYAMNGQDQLGRYRTVTVYPDVRPSHWAAPYINMASDSGRGSAGDKDTADHSIIKGYVDGKFHPGDIMTYGQGVTILMRMLGYQDGDVGGVWPDGYLSQAAAVGLTEGVASAPGAPLTRGQAARLFINLLNCDKNGGGSYAVSIASRVEEGMLASSSATAPDGSDTALQMSGGAVYTMANKKTSTGALNGLKGKLLLDKSGKVLTFVPEIAGSSRTVSFGSGTASQLTTTSGEKIPVNGTTPINVNGEQKTWAAAYTWLNPGTSLTLYLGASGGVEYIFAGGGTASTAAVVVYDKGSTAGFSGLAGGSTQYSIYKNGGAATAADMRPYDVATYSPATNSIRVSDTRITGVYENAAPNTSNPTTITVMGQEFKVLSTAADTMSKLKLGEQITLLLTEDNQVAGALKADGAKVFGNAIGVVREVSSASVTIDLLCGLTITGKTSLSESEVSKLKGQLATVASSMKGMVSVSRMSGGVAGDLDIAAKRLGTKSLADNVVIYQSASDGAKVLSLSQISAARVPSSGVIYARTNWAGKIDLLLLSNITGSDYQFGRLAYTSASEEPQYDKDGNLIVDGSGNPVTSKKGGSIVIITGNGTQLGPFNPVFTAVDDAEFTSGDYVGVKLNRAGTAIESMMALTEFGGVANSAWSSPTSVTIGGRSYAVPEDVQCYNRSSARWVTLDEARAFATTATLFADKTGYIRIVEVK